MTSSLIPGAVNERPSGYPTTLPRDRVVGFIRQTVDLRIAEPEALAEAAHLKARVLTFITRRVRGRENAEDIAQEVMAHRGERSTERGGATIVVPAPGASLPHGLLSSPVVCWTSGSAVLDDFHWTDPASADLLAALLHRPPAAGVLLVVAARPRQLAPRLATALGVPSATGSWRASSSPR